MCYFSIIIPVYNAEKYISRCVDSILEQKYKDYEVLLLDDQSDDGSVALCMNYSNKYINIHTHKLIHCGASQARNYGIERAKGKYIVFVDADDYLQEEMLLKIYSDICEQEPDVCYMGKHYVNLDSKKEINSIIRKEKLFDGNSVTQEKFWDRIVASKSGIPGSMWLVVVNREFLVRKEIKINPKYIWSEDSDFSYKIITNATKISICDYPGYVWCIDNVNSVSKHANAKKIISRMEVYRKWYYYFDSNFIDETIKDYVCKYILKNYSSCLVNYSFLKEKEKGIIKKVFDTDGLWKKYQYEEYAIFYKYGLFVGSIIYKYVNYLKRLIESVKL